MSVTVTRLTATYFVFKQGAVRIFKIISMFNVTIMG